MGTVTPNIGIYIPADGEDFYGQSFSSGMTNIDNHDHSGGPNMGVPLSASAIGNHSITGIKLNGDVVKVNGGITYDSGGTNNLSLTSDLLQSFNSFMTVGLLVNLGGSPQTAGAVTLQEGDSNIVITNPDGTGGDPTFALNPTITIEAIDSNPGPLDLKIAGNIVATLSDSLLDLSPGQLAVNSFQLDTAVVPFGVQIDIVAIDLNQVWLFQAVSNIADNAFHCMVIVYSFNVGALVFFPIDNTNCDIVQGVGTAQTVAIKNTSGGANRSFTVSGIRLF